MLTTSSKELFESSSIFLIVLYTNQVWAAIGPFTVSEWDVPTCRNLPSSGTSSNPRTSGLSGLVVSIGMCPDVKIYGPALTALL